MFELTLAQSFTTINFSTKQYVYTVLTYMQICYLSIFNKDNFLDVDRKEQLNIIQIKNLKVTIK